MIPWLDPSAPVALHVLLLCHLAMFGAASGSFAGVLISRIPQLESVVRPRSRCDGCARTLRIYENIPIVSYLVLGGRCRTCRARLGLRALIVEVLCASLFVALAVRLASPFELMVWLVVTTLLLALTYIDLDYFWLPDSLTASLALVALLGAMLPGRLGLVAALIGMLPALGLWLFAWSYARLFGKEGLGLGDIKLLAALGLVVGVRHVVAILTLACLEGALIGTLMLLLRRELTQMKAVPPALVGDDWQPDPHAVPFGPFLALGALQSMLCPELIEGGHAMLVRAATALAQRIL